MKVNCIPLNPLHQGKPYPPDMLSSNKKSGVYFHFPTKYVIGQQSLGDVCYQKNCMMVETDEHCFFFPFPTFKTTMVPTGQSNGNSCNMLTFVTPF